MVKHDSDLDILKGVSLSSCFFFVFINIFFLKEMLNGKDCDKVVQDKMDLMTKDAKYLHLLVKKRKCLVKDNEELLKKESRERMTTLEQIREEHSLTRTAKNESKENERQKISRTLMAKLVTAADFPGCPDYVPAMINVLKNILGMPPNKMGKYFFFKKTRNYFLDAAIISRIQQLLMIFNIPFFRNFFSNPL